MSSGHELADDEKLNFLGLGVADGERGKGLASALASKIYVKLVEQGAKYLGYGQVLDDNWPSRRTAERLGGYIWANSLVYRRNL